MKKLVIGLLALVSLNCFAVDVNGEAMLSYSRLGNSADIIVYDEIAEAMYQNMRAKVISDETMSAKYGDGLACFKFVNSRNQCRVTVSFLNR
jgi:hypothetical protein